MREARVLKGIPVMAVLVLSVAAASAQEREPALTTSKKLILMPGSNSISARVPAPACPPGLYFLVRQLAATPEVIDGQTAVEVMGLPYWAVSATVYQLRAKTAIQRALAAHGRGPTVAQVAMEGGQFAGLSS